MNRILSQLRKPQVWGFFVSVIVMAVISLAFFYPDAFDGTSLRQADMQQGAANGHEAQQWFEQTGEKALWTNSLFGGMPTFQISPSYPSNSLFDWLNTVYGLGLPSPANLLFMMMFGFLILLYTMKMRWYYALIGAIAWGFSSYFVIIIGAGHIWKFVALTYIPPTIAGMMLCYRGRYIAGAALLSLFATLQLNANHPQMTYYFLFVMVALVIAWLVIAIKEQKVKQWGIASAVCVAAGLLAVGANSPSLYNTYEYSKETKRSQSELTPLASQHGASDSDERPTGGLPKQDIIGWSYGGSESFSLLIPNIKGGATARPEQGSMNYMSLSAMPEAAQYTDTQAGALLPYLPQYFNDSEGTNGPVYIGAIIFALFLLGCFIVKGPTKWALLIMTVLSILLALGRNFETLTDLMIYHFPLYNKFRAVESILVIAEFTMPLLGIMALQQLFSTDNALTRYRRELAISFGVPAVICLAAIAVPSIFGEAITDSDRATVTEIQNQVMQMAQSYNMTPQEASQAVYQYSLSNPENEEAITSLRYGMVKADGWRSLIFIIIGAGAIVLGLQRKIKPGLATAIVGVAVLVDLYAVDKRYVSHSSFCTPEQSQAEMFVTDDIDRAILADTAQSYRVMDIPGFTQANRSYFHKMIGGYHAAKLNRFEDIIQRQLTPVLSYGYAPELRDDSIVAQYAADQQEVLKRLRTSYKVLDMLNARYIITGDKDYPVMENSYAKGNAWLVGDIQYVDNADAEMAALTDLDINNAAVADSKYKDVLGSGKQTVTSGDTIYLTSYSPNTLRYHANVAKGATGVFSEVYFPWGWHATIDGNDAQIGRVNYLLRALQIPAGKHEIVMTFDPQSIHTCSTIAYICIILIYLLCFAGLFMAYKKCEA
jgi:hypothetical protein